MRHVGGSEINRNILVDGNNILHKATYIYCDTRLRASLPLMMSRYGFQTGTIFGFLKFLVSYIKDIGNFSRVLVSFDGISKRRRTIYPDYKGNRDHSRDVSVFDHTLTNGKQIRSGLDVLKEILRLLNVDTIHVDDYESDDVIFNLIEEYQDQVNVIVSDDKDYFQCLTNPRTVIYRPGDNQNRFVDAEVSEQIWSRLNGGKHPPIPPGKVRLFKALCGDSSDNINGIPRLRKRVASELSNHVTVENLYSSDLSNISESDRLKLLEYRDRVSLNYDLVGFDRIDNVLSYVIKGNRDLEAARSILYHDCNIYDLDLSVFSPPKKELTATIPEWLSSV